MFSIACFTYDGSTFAIYGYAVACLRTRENHRIEENGLLPNYPSTLAVPQFGSGLARKCLKQADVEVPDSILDHEQVNGSLRPVAAFSSELNNRFVVAPPLAKLIAR